MILYSCGQQEWARYDFKWNSCKSQYLDIVLEGGFVASFSQTNLVTFLSSEVSLEEMLSGHVH